MEILQRIIQYNLQMVDMVEVIDKDHGRGDMGEVTDRVINDIVDVFYLKKWFILDEGLLMNKR